jgi:phage terminase large subunit-like protein
MLSRIVIAVDPPAKSTENSNECGIVGVGQDRDRGAYVLADRSSVMSPEEWAKAAVGLYKELEADCIVAEVNQGGEMVAAVIRSVDRNVPIKMVHASRGKYVRAEPISAIYARGVVYHVEMFEALEDQMCTYTPDFDRLQNGSPDRMDALVWGMTELFPQMVAPVVMPKARKMVVR